MKGALLIFLYGRGSQGKFYYYSSSQQKEQRVPAADAFKMDNLLFLKDR